MIHSFMVFAFLKETPIKILLSIAVLVSVTKL